MPVRPPNARNLGWIVLIGVLIVRGLAALMVEGGFTVFQVLSVLFALLYMTGAVELILRRRWASTLLLLAGTGDIVARLIRAAVLLLREPPGPFSEEEPFLFEAHLAGLILPVAITAVSRWLRRHPEAFTAVPAPPRPPRPPWLKPLTWALAGSGFLLPVLIGLVVSLVQAAKGEPAVFLGEGASLAFLTAVCFAGPFHVLAFVGYSMFSEDLGLPGVALARRLFLFAGICVGTAVAIAIGLSKILYTLDTEQFEGLFLILFPILSFELAVPGALAGGFAGWACFQVWRRTGHGHGGPATPAEAGGRWL